MAVDGSEVSLRAAEHAAHIAKQDGAELLALHVVPAPQFEMQGGLADNYANARRDAKKWMKVVEDIAARNGVGLKAEIVVGAYSVVDAILGYAETVKADLIVTGTRGTTPSRRILVGSVASGLVEYSGCAVLVIREKSPEGALKLAVARLVRVTLEAPRAEVGRLLAEIIGFTEFHPSRKEGMVQDIGLLLLSSKAHEVYAHATELLEEGMFKTGDREKQVEKFEAHDVHELVRELEEYLEIIEKNLSLFTEADDRWGVTQVLLAIQEASLMVFDDLQRIFVYPSDGATVRFEGFVPAHSLDRLKAMMGGYAVTAEPVKTQGKDVAYVPTLLVNPRLVSLFESLTLERGLPRYGEVDPTPILAFVFPFFFGVMFADVGHGAVLLAFGLYLVYRTAYKNWGELILVLSVSTMVFGFVRGSFFGVAFTSPLERVVSLPSALGASFTLSSIPFLLEVAVLIGAFHLASGYAIAFVNQVRAGNYLDALLDRLPTIVLYSFLIPLGFAVAGTGLDLAELFTSAAPTPIFDNLLGLDIPIAATATVSLPVIVATLLVMIAGHPIRDYLSTHSLRGAARGLSDGLLEAVAKPFEFFLNTISYIRLGVLLITTTLLGSLVAGVLAYGVVGVAIAALLNVAVIALEGVVVYIQDMRLQLYEWLSQFYAGTGTPFVPLVSGGSHFKVGWSAKDVPPSSPGETPRGLADSRLGA